MGVRGKGRKNPFLKGFFLPFPRPPEAQPSPAPGAARRGLDSGQPGRAGYFFFCSGLVSRM
jgi:hypothetical protein